MILIIIIIKIIIANALEKQQPRNHITVVSRFVK